MHVACTVKILLAPPPGALGRGRKVKYHLISITKSILKIFIPNFACVFKDFYTKLCVCSHKIKIQNISEEIFILYPGSCPSGGTLGCFKGSKIKYRLSDYYAIFS